VRGEGAERGMLSGKFLGPMWGAFAMLILAPPLIAASSLPVVEVAATGGQSDTLAVMVSGDGGWAPIDRSIASVLAQNGIPVAGLNALQYFWKRRTPDEAARDLQQIVETHLAAWGKRRIVFIGYSRGADVLPAMIARLPPTLRPRIRLIALLGPSPTVEFEFHVADWMRNSSKGIPVKPDVDKLRDLRILCIQGEDDRDSLCPLLSRVTVVTLKGAHHFDGGYEKLARIILEHLP
jgi:type IV secretory pathway VirJ component